jgi:hypothetical protein
MYNVDAADERAATLTNVPQPFLHRANVQLPRTSLVSHRL